MDIVHVVLRLIHIVAGLAWFGLGLAMTVYVAPSAARAGQSGYRFLKTLFTTTSFGSVFAAVGGTTVLAGILMYVLNNSAAEFTTTGNMVLGIGALAGILAMLHGGAATGKATGELVKALQQHVPDGETAIPNAALPELQALSAKLLRHSQISMVLLTIALLGMGLARHL